MLHVPTLRNFRSSLHPMISILSSGGCMILDSGLREVRRKGERKRVVTENDLSVLL